MVTRKEFLKEQSQELIDEMKKEQQEAKKFFNSLSYMERFDLLDNLVLGDCGWELWFDKKPSEYFLRRLSEELMMWEDEQ